MIGMEPMLHALGMSPHDPSALRDAIGKKITAIRVDEGSVEIEVDGGGFSVSDEGQSCCEWRYITCDDDYEYLVGAEFRGAQLKYGGSEEIEGGYGCHDVEFVEFLTDRGSFTVCTHNEHNGYYGGFAICVKALR